MSGVRHGGPARLEQEGDGVEDGSAASQEDGGSREVVERPVQGSIEVHHRLGDADQELPQGARQPALALWADVVFHRHGVEHRRCAWRRRGGCATACGRHARVRAAAFGVSGRGLAARRSQGRHGADCPSRRPVGHTCAGRGRAHRPDDRPCGARGAAAAAVARRRRHQAPQENRHQSPAALHLGSCVRALRPDGAADACGRCVGEARVAE
mmetsp:Transcript_56153/g.162681  ORF Transcript_56153/g.162681 Transcript_56153/m.162681 type:complete len:211 (-) Transcript_56153:108-740(-)